MFVCPRSCKKRFACGHHVQSKKRCVVPCISSLSLPLAPCNGGLRRPFIRCQRLREYTQLAHARVVDMARVSQPRASNGSRSWPGSPVLPAFDQCCQRTALGSHSTFSLDRLDGTEGCIINVDRSTRWLTDTGWRKLGALWHCRLQAHIPNFGSLHIRSPNTCVRTTVGPTR